MISVGHRIPAKNILLSTGPMKSKADMLNTCRLLKDKAITYMLPVALTAFC